MTAADPTETGRLRPRFTLHVVATLDGFIARRPGHAPAEWASREEQALFRAAVAAADWSVMGRRTHEAAPRAERRRVVFTRSAPSPEWRGPRHLWLDPADLSPDSLADLVGSARPMRQAAVLGGVAVHDWFHAHGRIDAVSLTVEPVRFGGGLPIFSDQAAENPVRVFLDKGYVLMGGETLNAAGTELVRLAPGSDARGEETS